MGIRVGIDTGGTFTDLIAIDEDSGQWHIAKVPSTPSRPVEALRNALGQVNFDPSAISSIVVGTTIGINAVLTRSGSRVVYLTTKGFEDVPHIQRIIRKNHYDFVWRKPKAFVRRGDCIGIDERVNYEGEVVSSVDPEEVRQLLSQVNGEDFAVAVSFLFSYLNPESENSVRDAIAQFDPDMSVSLSHELAPIWREYERGTVAILDAYVKPAVDGYVDGVTEAFEESGVGHGWSLLKSNGGHAVAQEASTRPAHILLSGIAGGAIGGAHYARQRDATKGIVLDMGGTSCDVCLIVDGEPQFSSEYEIEFGLPVAVPTVSTRTIGAGGGSIGWVDPGGFLQVGPQSAGSEPGPACYGKGGDEPTLTDANVVLGRLNPQYFLGGTLVLDPEASRRALRTLADELSGDEISVASSMIRTANETMANAVRIVTVEEGVDPRDHALIAMGGAGPTHAAEIAEAIGIERVIVPLHPGLTSAFGALVADVRVDEVKSVNLKSPGADAAELDQLFTELVDTAVANFRAQGRSDAKSQVLRSIAMRYEGQNYEQEISVPDGVIDDESLELMLEQYHQLHQTFYGYRLDGLAVEMVRLTATATGDAEDAGWLPALSLDVDEGASAKNAPAARTVEVHFGDGFVPTPVVPRSELSDGGTRSGPLIVESLDTTVVVPPSWDVELDETGIIELRRVHDGAATASTASAVSAENQE